MNKKIICINIQLYKSQKIVLFKLFIMTMYLIAMQWIIVV